jgi:hypothetical protein
VYLKRSRADPNVTANVTREHNLVTAKEQILSDLRSLLSFKGVPPIIYVAVYGGGGTQLHGGAASIYAAIHLAVDRDSLHSSEQAAVYAPVYGDTTAKGKEIALDLTIYHYLVTGDKEIVINDLSRGHVTLFDELYGTH